jgi:hypothetical protein
MIKAKWRDIVVQCEKILWISVTLALATSTALTFLAAYYLGDGQILIDINHFGEAKYELWIILYFFAGLLSIVVIDLYRWFTSYN